jgi:intein-encoded DNA endonuclease-like protein
MEFLPIDYIAGFFDGEGCVTMSAHLRSGRNPNRKTPEIIPVIVFSQKKPLILVKIQESLKELDIKSNLVILRKPQTYQLKITSIENILNFCNLMIPFTICKRVELELMKEYCERRLSQKIGKSNFKPYTDVDFAYVENLRELKICLV